MTAFVDRIAMTADNLTLLAALPAAAWLFVAPSI